MYKIKFSEYNHLMQCVLSEEDTLQNIIDLSLNGKPSKEEKMHLVNTEKWAKYAFEKDNTYNIVFYNEDKLYARMCITDMDITIDFLEDFNSKIEKGLTLVYDRLDMKEYFETDKKVYYDNKDLFLGQMESWDKSDSKSVFTRVSFGINNIASVTISISSAIENESKTVSQAIDLNCSNNFLRSPKDYKDFEYLLDYKENIKSEYFDLPLTIEDNKHKDNKKSDKQDKPKGSPGTTWSLLDDKE